MFRYTFFLIALFGTISSFAQEKRLALVIGNANYDKGVLTNPVNDALLMKKTLEALDFDVILDTNISTFSDFKETVYEFGNRRNNYNVGIIYYAGHGIQIENVNYLLATKEKYDSELDVEFNALSVQYLMKFLTSQTDEVNVLILDACRDNPFEKSWNPQARSATGGKGLASIPPPTGSLIAYSTDAGNTAADGKNGNSVYCVSLTKNMLLENVSLDQVFRNVRAEVISESDGNQRPVEASQLTGEAFYLKKSDYINVIEEIDSLLEIENFKLSGEKIISILTYDPTNKKALLRKGRLELLQFGEKYDASDIKKAIQLFPKDAEVYEYMAMFYSVIGKPKDAIDEINKSIKLDSLNPQYFHWRALYYEQNDQIKEAFLDYTKAIDLEPYNSIRYTHRANHLRDHTEDFEGALIDFSKAIELSKNNSESWYKRGYFYYFDLQNTKKALEDFEVALQINPGDIDVINAIGFIYKENKKPELAIAEYEKCIALKENAPESAAYCYSNRAEIYSEQEKFIEALNDYSKAIELDPDNAERYNKRAQFFQNYMQDFNNAFLDFSKAIELDPKSTTFWYNRGTLSFSDMNDDKKAIEDFNQVLNIDPSDIDAINVIGLIYLEQGKTDLAIAQYEKGIELKESSPESAAYCYSNRAGIYAEQGKLEKALADYSSAIKIDPKNPIRFGNRALFFQNYLEDYESALTDFSKAIELNPNLIDFWYGRGYLYQNYILDNTKALDDFEKVLKIDPTYINAINMIGVILTVQGKTDLAIAQYEKGIALKESAPESAAYCYSNRAGIYAEQDKLDEALNDYAIATELDPANANRYYERAQFFQDYMRDFNNAFLDFSRAIELDPKSTTFWYSRGSLFFYEMNDDKKAIEDFNQVLNLDSSHIPAINSIGLICMAQGKTDLAINYFERGIALKESYPENAAFSYSNRAEIYSKQGKLDEALNDYTSAIELNKDFPNRYIDRALFFQYYKQDYEKALEDFSKAIELEPTRVDFWYYRGELYSDFIINDKKALYDFNQVLNLDMSDIDAINSIGLIYMAQGKTDLAINYFERGIALKESNPESAAFCYSNRALIYFEQSKFEEAKNDYTKAIELDKENSTHYWTRANFNEKMKMPYEALVDYSLALSLDSTNAGLWFARSSLYSNYLNDHTSAISDCEQLIKLDSNDAAYINWIGIYYHRMGMFKEASDYYDLTISKIGSDFKDSVNAYTQGIAWSFNNRALLFARTKEYSKSNVYFTNAIKYDPNEPLRYFWRGSFICDYLKDYENSLSDINHAINLDPENPRYFLFRARIYLNKLDEKNSLKDFNEAIKISNNNPMYQAHRGNYFMKMSEFEKAEKDFENALKLDSTIPKIYHLKMELLKEQKLVDESILLGKKCISTFENDTTAYSLLGELYTIKKDYVKALKYLNEAISIMEFNSAYQSIEPDFTPVYLSDCYYKIAEIYAIIQDKELQCESLLKAQTSIELETRPDKIEFENLIAEKIKQMCK
jgi:tetratricopeptide (TPR) repeat protein